MKILLNIGIAILATFAIYILYLSGSFIANLIGHTQRGGINWNISVFYASFFMFPSMLLTLWLYQRFKNRYILATTIGFILFVVLSSFFLGNQFFGSGWIYPYRFLYLQFCALIIFSTLPIKQLTKR